MVTGSTSRAGGRPRIWPRHLAHFHSFVAAAFLAGCLPTDPPDAERVTFRLDFKQPYRVPAGAVVTPPIKIAVKDKVLRDAAYRLEATGIVRVDETGRGLHGLQRGTTSVRVVYPTATGAPDTVFQVQVVVSLVSIDPAQHTLTRLQDSVRLSANALDANESVVPNTTFRWFSHDTSVAKVSQTGVVTAVDEGTASITAEADSLEGRASVTVVQVASAVSLSPEADTLRTVGRSTRFAALAFDSTGHVITPAKPRWTSSDIQVAMVDGTGLVTATGAGSAKIIARVGSAADTATLVVAQVVRLLFILPAFDTLTAIDDTARLKAEARDSLRNVIPNPTVGWVSSDTTIVTVDQTGLLRALRNGAAVVTASSGRQSAFATVVVRQLVTQVRMAVDSVTLTGEGGAVSLDVVAFDRNGYVVSQAPRLRWASSMELVATVDSTGRVTAHGDGTTRVSASPLDAGAADTIRASSDTVTVTVTGAPQQLIAFESQRGIEVVRPDGSQRTVLIHNFVDMSVPEGLTYTDPAWSPDGTRLALSINRWDWGDCSTDNNVGGCVDVYTVSPGGSDPVNVSNYHLSWVVDDEAAWSPDGARIAFTSTRGWPAECSSGIYVMNADGSEVERLSDVPGANPAWAPDGSRIAFERRCDFWSENSAEIYIVNADGTGAVNLTNHPAHDYQPAWSPDGTQLAFVSNRDNEQRHDMWLMNADGTGARNLTSTLAAFLPGETNPAWSPDGTQIAFVASTSECECGTDLYVMRVDGTDVRRLTNTDSESEWRPTWGRAIRLQSPPDVPRRHPGSPR